MKKKIVLFVLSVVFTGLCITLYPKEKVEIAAVTERYTFVCPLTWENHAGGIVNADKVFSSNTKFVGFTSANVAKQIEAIRNAINANVEGIITSGVQNSEEFIKVIHEASEKGIPVVLLDTDVPASDRICFIGTDNYEAGKMAARDLAEAAGDSARIGIIVSKLDTLHQSERVKGFEEELKRFTDMKVIKILECESDKTKINEYVPKMLKENTEIDAIYCTEGASYSMMGGILGRMGSAYDEVMVVGFDIKDPIMKYIESGRYYSAIAQQQYRQGYLAVQYLQQYRAGQKIEKDIIYTEAVSIKKGSSIEQLKSNENNEEVIWHLY